MQDPFDVSNERARHKRALPSSTGNPAIRLITTRFGPVALRPCLSTGLPKKCIRLQPGLRTNAARVYL